MECRRCFRKLVQPGMFTSMITARGFTPQVGRDVFVADGAKIIGDVHIGDHCSIWYNTTLRGDVMPIKIGRETNIQDGSTDRKSVV